MIALVLSAIALDACRTKDTESVKTANAVEVVAPSRDAAADSARVEYYTAAALAHVGDSLARGSTSGHMLHSHDRYQYLQIRRGKSGVPEVHDRWTDVTMVQAGRATLLSGGRVSGSHVETPGEHRGGTIAGGTSRPVGPGDLMIIPAGIPHQYVIAAGDSLRYITVKVLGTDVH
jgi:mannose-6-phosphate isomerase-like protein (cupin superfamily)